MKVDSLQIPGQGSLKVSTRAGAYTDSLREGDRVKAEVLASEKGAVVLKTESGQTFRARLDADVTLLPGEKVTLEVAGKEKGIVSLAIRGKEPAADETAAQAVLVRDFKDKSLAAFASKLAELKMPVSEETASVMRELTVKNPGMSLEEAAFLASNKLAGDENLVRAALAVLSGGEKTDEMLARLMSMLEFPDSRSYNSQFPPLVSQSAESARQDIQFPFPDSQFTEPSPTNFPLSDLLSRLATIVAPDIAEIPQYNGQHVSSIISQEIISQSDSSLQSFSTNNVENLQNAVLTDLQPIAAQQNQPLENVETQIKNAQIQAGPDLAAATQAPVHESGIRGYESAGAPVDAVVSAEKDVAGTDSVLPGKSAVSDTRAVEPNPGLRIDGPPEKVIAEILSDIPEFRGTPAPALERFSNMLLRVAKDSTATLGGDTKMLAGLLDKLFTRIERSDKDSGERLRTAREEMFARLALIEEAISRAPHHSKTEMLEQTRRLMDHVRLLNSIDQFVYVQLPVKMGEDRKTAELYLFRRKNGKRVDPENANILLALELENMGHWEALINIRNKDVSIKMEVAGAAEKGHFSEKTVLLHDMLAEAGFRLVSTGITYSDEETTPLTALSAFDRYTSGRSGLIDFVV